MPDDDGFYFNDSVGLGMRRLSIIDLKSGKQPIHNQDRTAWIVFNGEIYNYRELREQLEKLGHTFYTNSDTEAIVHAYDQYGADCPNHLRGMFAFAIWDERTQELFLARDRVGKKPLLYAQVNGQLIFGSDSVPYFYIRPSAGKFGRKQFITISRSCACPRRSPHIALSRNSNRDTRSAGARARSKSSATGSPTFQGS